ncbi:MAG: hypothetical protein V1872_03525 [bacterium]
MKAPETERNFQEIWKLFKETDRMLSKRFKETDERFKETGERFKETGERFKETDERFKETSRKLEETGERIRETDRILEERFKQMEIAVEKATRSVDDLTGKWGKFVEGLILPAVERLFKERGIEISRVYPRARSRKSGETMEIDILGINGEYAVLIEAKSTLRIEHVNGHIKRLSKFKTFFSEYRDRKLVGAIGGIVVEQEAATYAFKKGLLVIVESGNSVKFLNEMEFKPRVW